MKIAYTHGRGVALKGGKENLSRRVVIGCLLN